MTAEDALSRYEHALQLRRRDLSDYARALALVDTLPPTEETDELRPLLQQLLADAEAELLTGELLPRLEELNTHGLRLLQEGRNAEAARLFERVLTVAPGDSLAREQLAALTTEDTERTQQVLRFRSPHAWRELPLTAPRDLILDAEKDALFVTAPTTGTLYRLAEPEAAPEPLRFDGVREYQGLAIAPDSTCWLTDSRNRRICLLYTSPSPRDRTRSRMPSSA